jgi:predicted lipoprotein with Yx(FWY)xxD motif
VRISVLLVTVTSIAAVVGAFGPPDSLVQGADYTVAVRATTGFDLMESAILTNAEGRTLYYSSADTPTRSTCTGVCAKTWSPLVSKAKPTMDPKIRGTLGVVHTVHGAQVTFNRHLLYTYALDMAPGEAAGKGIGGKWFIATPALASW